MRKLLCTAVLLSASIFNFTGCEETEENGPTPPIVTTDIVGTWNEAVPFTGMRLVINADGTITSESDLPGSVGEKVRRTGTYILGDIVSESPYMRKLDITWNTISPEDMILGFSLPAVDYCLFTMVPEGMIIGGYTGDNACVFGALSEAERPISVQEGDSNSYALVRQP